MEVNKKHSIRATQFLFTVICIIQASSLLNAFISGTLYNESWLGVILTMIAFIPVILVYIYFIKKYPDKNFLEICEEIFGKVIGKIIAIFYMLFFIILTAFNVRDMGYFTKSTMLTQTPLPVILLIAVLPCCMAVKSGISATTRYSKLFVISSIAIAGIIVIFIYKEVDFTNLLPIFNHPKKNYAKGIIHLMVFPFGELLLMLMSHQYLNYDNKKTRWYLFLGFLIGGLIFLIVTIRDIAALGTSFYLFSTPSLVTFQLVNIEEIFSRMDILFTVVFTSVLFIKVSYYYYVSLLAIKVVFNLKEARHLSYVLGMFICFIALNISTNQLDYLIYSRNSVSVMFFFPLVVFPIIIFFFALFKKKKVT